MLSRVAERTYWFGRLLERAENTARLIDVNANLLLDLPRMAGRIWSSLIDITGSNTAYYVKYARAEERYVLRYILAEPSNSASLLNSVKQARENARVTREVIPAEVWEKINELNLYVTRTIDKGIKRDGRHKFLKDIILACNQIIGLLNGGMSHGDALNFIRIGGFLERADMVTRIIDVGCLNLLKKNGENSVPPAFEDLLWMNVLRSLSAYQMYRQHVKDRVNGEDVVDFLLKDLKFPRSVGFCLGVINRSISSLNRNDIPLRSVTHTQRLIQTANINELMMSGLHAFIDEIQIDFAELHTQVEQAWFGYTPTPESAAAPHAPATASAKPA